MANLYNKHFGNKVFLEDLNLKTQQILIGYLLSFSGLKWPLYGTLVRNGDTGCVGIMIIAKQVDGSFLLVFEKNKTRTIKSWAEYHMKKRK